MERIFNNMKESRHRRLFFVAGEGREVVDKTSEILRMAEDSLGTKEFLYMAEFPEYSTGDEERYAMLSDEFKLRRYPYARGKEILGKTFEGLILDAHENFPAREVGISIETVRGPGVIIVMMPPIEEWLKRKLFLHKQYVVTPPYRLEDCRNVYQKRVIKKAIELPGIYIWEKELSGKEPETKKERRKRIKIKEGRFPQELYKMAYTEDQYNVLRRLEETEDEAVVILANRGRGKSAVLGLYIAGLGSLGEKKKIVVTAPTEDSVDELFKFIRLGGEKVGIKVRGSRRKLKVGSAKVLFREPLEVMGLKGDILVVDEAAGIYVSILKEYLDRFDTQIYSTTVHGYEGTGRLFQYRFLPSLKEKKKVEILRMSEPIRYGTDDPVERWLYEVYLLDAEPAKVKDVKGLSFERRDIESLFLRDENILKEYIGIYVFAHYRNNPRDITILADAPNQRAYMVFGDKHVVSSLQVAEEGGLGDEDIYRFLEGDIVYGNIIPDIFVRYYEFAEFAREKGLRIVRIATHPDLQGRGIGSFALKSLESEAKKEGMAWTGAGFGASYEVVRFWKKNGYTMVHVSPKRNPASGEYTTIFVKPLKEKIKRYINIANMVARRRLLEEMDNYYSGMEPSVAVELLTSGRKIKMEPDITEAEMVKLRRYIEGYLNYDTVSDIVKRIVTWYFMADGETLPQTDAMFLVEKVLKKKNWTRAAKTFNMEPSKFSKKFDSIVERLYEVIR